MRTVVLAWNIEIGEGTIVQTVNDMFTKLTGRKPNIIIGRGLIQNGLPEGNIYVEAI